MQKDAQRTRFFYQNGKLISLVTGEDGRTIFRTPAVALGERQGGNSPSSGLLGTDQQGSVLHVTDNK
ncbi:hypothetical protein HP546_04745 [Pseudomonas sp. CM25]|uniref:hypothetical protein n=1 Tax=Pseudomonas sp. CM25 TaxID=2738448 RepID=UPI0015550701|nr:hypothetical protein [Pseudomonas sp. CM25]NQD54664.1 hypothetical protein [Pseudomonas sp. CM25]